MAKKTIDELRRELRVKAKRAELRAAEEGDEASEAVFRRAADLLAQDPHAGPVEWPETASAQG